VGTQVHLTGHTTCGGTPVYAWALGAWNGTTVNWQSQTPYGTGTTYTWNTTGLAPGQYLIDMWVENQGGPASSYDTYAAQWFTVSR
jgi:hypothetical protein